MLWTGPVGPVEHQHRRRLRRDLPARLQRQPRDDLRARTSTCSSTTRAARPTTAFDFVTWLTSAKVHLQFAIATGDLPAAPVGDHAAGLPDVPEEVPGREGLRRQPRQRQARAAQHRGVRAGLDAPSARWCSRCCSARPQPDEALEHGARRRSPRRWPARDAGSTAGQHPAAAPRSRRRATAAAASGRRLRGVAGSDALTGWAMVSPSVVLIGLFGLLPVGLVVRAVVPAQRPADAGPVGRPRQLPPARCTTRSSSSRCGTPSSTPCCSCRSRWSCRCSRRPR